MALPGSRPEIFVRELEQTYIRRPISFYDLATGKEISLDELNNSPYGKKEYGVRTRDTKEILGNLSLFRDKDGRDGTMQYRGKTKLKDWEIIAVIWRSPRAASRV